MYGNNNNNGYGNGNNNGYGFGGMNQDYIDRMDRAKRVDNERDPFIREGNHTLCLLELFEYPHEEKGPVAKARFLVLESKTHAVGSTVCKLWFLTKPGKFKDSITDSDRFADFVMKLKGVDPQKPEMQNFRIGAEIRNLIRPPGLFSQFERGRVLFASGRNVAKADKDPFIDVSWRSLQNLQTPEQVAQKRGELDANEVTAYSRQLQKVFRDIEAMGQMQQAPHASQQPQYAPQGQQQGYQPAPQQYAPQQGNPQSQTWQLVNQQQWQQPPQQGYGQPMQNPVPQQPAPQGPPPGGFLAQIPPQGPGFGQGNNGGQGGGWQ